MSISFFVLFSFLGVDRAAQELLEDVFCAQPQCELPLDCCPVCSKKYKNYCTLKQHIINKHSDCYVLEGKDVASSTTDSVLAHTKQLLKVLLMKRCLDYAIKTANGEIVSLLIKHMILYFHKFGYKNYALACFEHVAHCQFFLSERTKELVQQEGFVNNRGGAETNMPMDLDLEHSNKFFKEHFTLKTNVPSQSVLDRLSLSQDKLEKTLQNFYQEFKIHRHTPLRSINSAGYKKDVFALHQHLSPRQMFVEKPGRQLYSSKLMEASHDVLLLIDMYKFKQWLKTSLIRCSDQRFLQ